MQSVGEVDQVARPERVARTGARGDYCHVVANDVGRDEAVHTGAVQRHGQTSCPPAQDAFAKNVHHADRCARCQQSVEERAHAVARHAVNRCGKQRRGPPREQHQYVVAPPNEPHDGAEGVGRCLRRLERKGMIAGDEGERRDTLCRGGGLRRCYHEAADGCSSSVGQRVHCPPRHGDRALARRDDPGAGAESGRDDRRVGGNVRIGSCNTSPVQSFGQKSSGHVRGKQTPRLLRPGRLVGSGRFLAPW